MFILQDTVETPEVPTEEVPAKSEEVVETPTAE